MLASSTTAKSLLAENDIDLDMYPSPFWRVAAPIYLETDTHGHRVPNYRTDVRSRWTKQNLHFLFTCPFEELNLKPDPNTSTETYKLCNWDVAEVFIGADFNDMKHYREFEVSPQGE